MANSYIQMDDGADVDPFWQTALPPNMRKMTLDERLNELKKSFHKNASKVDFTSNGNENFVLGKIGTNEENTEYMIWKSSEVIKGDNLTEEILEIFRTHDEHEARNRFQEVTDGTYNVKVKTKGTGLTGMSFDQPEIGKSVIENTKTESEMIQEFLNFKASSNFAKNAEKIDFVPDNQGNILVLGMVGKSQIDRDSRYRIWKTQNHWTNDRVEYLTDELDRRSAVIKFNEITKNL